MEYFFTSDEHYYHFNILKYSGRPFSSVEEMNEKLIENHNEVVRKNDITIHAGDFTLKSKNVIQEIVKRLKGQHIFLRGSHDYWLPKSAPTRWERKIKDLYIVVDHYAMRTWARKHYDSVQLYGHSHGALTPIGRQYDVGVDNNNFYPVSFNLVKDIIEGYDDEDRM